MDWRGQARRGGAGRGRAWPGEARQGLSRSKRWNGGLRKGSDAAGSIPPLQSHGIHFAKYCAVVRLLHAAEAIGVLGRQ